MSHLDELEIAELERRCPNGVTSAQVIAFFRDRGVRLSEATFRRYVQLDLLPRCRRVGRKGRHRGSEGVYPVSVVRRLNDVKRLLAQDFTVEEVRALFRVSEDDAEAVRARIERVVGAVRESLDRQPDEILRRHLDELRDLGERVERKMRQIADHFARAGTKGRLAV